jgi:hypothetical protein
VGHLGAIDHRDAGEVGKRDCVERGGAEHLRRRRPRPAPAVAADAEQGVEAVLQQDVGL